MDCNDSVIIFFQSNLFAGLMKMMKHFSHRQEWMRHSQWDL